MHLCFGDGTEPQTQVVYNFVIERVRSKGHDKGANHGKFTMKKTAKELYGLGVDWELKMEIERFQREKETILNVDAVGINFTS